jgi:tRNA(fMet)-specific endonuclease VapC
VILDTNALSAVAEGDPRLAPVLRRTVQVAVPVIVLGEYRCGVSQSRYRQRYEQWLAEFLPHSVVLDVDQETAIHYARLRTELKKAGTPIPSNDVWIAALSRQHGLPVLTRDRHFKMVSGLRRANW